MFNLLAMGTTMLKRANDPVQQEVITLPVSSRALVLAGPGTGKTETVARRLAALLDSGVSPAEVLVLSFSRSAVKTLTQRLERLVSDHPERFEDLRHLAIRTFDAWTFRMLRRCGHAPDQLLSVSYDDNISKFISELTSENGDEIKQMLSGVRHIIVDELQDLSGVRGDLVLLLLRLLAPPTSKQVGFTLLGDPAQAIYGFSLRHSDSGLTAKALLSSLREDYRKDLKIFELKENYRAAPALAHLTTELRKVVSDSKLSTEKRHQRINEALDRSIERADGLDLNELSRTGESVAVLTRTNGDAIRIAAKIAGHDSKPPSVPIHLRTSGRRPGAPAWIGTMLGKVKGSTVSRSQFGNIYALLFGDNATYAAASDAVLSESTAWKRLLRACDSAENAATFDVSTLRDRLDWPDLFPDDEGEGGRGISAMTIHQSKGMEFDSVLLVDPDESQFGSGDADPIDESRRELIEEAEENANVVFVGASRAAKSLRRVGRDQIYPLSIWSFGQHGIRKRWGNWRNGWMNIEIGVTGDIDNCSFVDTKLHGDEGQVESVQSMLAQGAQSLRGQKVVLCKRPVAGVTNRFIYGICIQDGSTPGVLLGTTTEQLTRDLLSKLHGPKRHFHLPQKIFNLRIADVTTVSGRESDGHAIAPQWAASRIWLGVSLCGTGDFKT